MQFAKKIRIRLTWVDGFTFDSVNKDTARDAVERETTLPDSLKRFGEDVAFFHRMPQGFIEKPRCVLGFHEYFPSCRPYRTKARITSQAVPSRRIPPARRTGIDTEMRSSTPYRSICR